MSRSGWTRRRRVAKLAIPTALVPALLARHRSRVPRRPHRSPRRTPTAPRHRRPVLPALRQRRLRRRALRRRPQDRRHDAERHGRRHDHDPRRWRCRTSTRSTSTSCSTRPRSRSTAWPPTSRTGRGPRAHDRAGHAGSPGTPTSRSRSSTPPPRTRIFEGSFNPVYAGSGGLLIIGEPTSAPWWFPSNDHPQDKALYDFHLSVPERRRGADDRPAGLHADRRRAARHLELAGRRAGRSVPGVPGHRPVRRDRVRGSTGVPVVTAIGEGSGVGRRGGRGGLRPPGRGDRLPEGSVRQVPLRATSATSSCRPASGSRSRPRRGPTYSPLFWQGPGREHLGRRARAGAPVVGRQRLGPELARRLAERGLRDVVAVALGGGPRRHDGAADAGRDLQPVPRGPPVLDAQDRRPGTRLAVRRRRSTPAAR